MAMKKVQDLDFDGEAVKFEKAGQKLTGHYIGSRKVNTGLGLSSLHVFSTPKGNIGAWGSAQLDGKLASVPAGALTEVVYVSKIKHTKGFLKKFNVAFDDENIIDVGMPSTDVNFSSGEEPEEYSDDSSSDVDMSGELPDEPIDDVEVEAPRAALPRSSGQARSAPQAASAQRQAQVSNMLNKRRS